jgi:hypothetical protein
MEGGTTTLAMFGSSPAHGTQSRTVVQTSSHRLLTGIVIPGITTGLQTGLQGTGLQGTGYRVTGYRVTGYRVTGYRLQVTGLRLGVRSKLAKSCPRDLRFTNHRNKGLISVNRRTSLLSHLQYPVPYQSRLQRIYCSQCPKGE